MPCYIACPKMFEDMEDWCPSCRREWEADQAHQAWLRELVRRREASDAIPPATDLEWAAHLDELAPLEEVAACPSP